MGVIVVFKNGTGVGKTAYMTAQMKYVVKEEGYRRQHACRNKIEELNKTRTTPLSIPDDFPVYANYNAEILIGYKKYFSPYWLNPYYFGLPNQGKPVQAVVPYAALFFTEADGVYDSANKTSLPEAVRGMYNKNRHWHLDIWIELHRSMALHVAIRDIANKFVEIYDVKSKKDEYGRTVSTTWTLREFDNWRDVEKYLQGSNGKDVKKLYKTTTFTNDGDIYKCYNCEDCGFEFEPPENEDFSLLPQKSKVKLSELSENVAQYYAPGEPPGFRSKPENKPKEQKGK